MNEQRKTHVQHWTRKSLKNSIGYSITKTACGIYVHTKRIVKTWKQATCKHCGNRRAG